MNNQQKLNKSLLHECKHGTLKETKKLIKLGADLTYQDYSPILAATTWGKNDIVKYLLPHIKDKTDIKELIIENCLNQRNHTLLKWLIKHNFSTQFNNYYPIWHACNYGDIKSINILINHGSQFNRNDFDCLTVASRNGHRSVVKKILNHQNIPLLFLEEASLQAVCGGHLNILKLLHKHGVVLTYKNDRLLTTACEYGKLNIVKYLVQHGADVKIDKNLSIRVATITQYHDVTRYLLSKGVDIEEAINDATDKTKFMLQQYYEKYLSKKDLEKSISNNIKKSYSPPKIKKL